MRVTVILEYYSNCSVHSIRVVEQKSFTFPVKCNIDHCINIVIIINLWSELPRICCRHFKRRLLYVAFVVTVYACTC